MLSGLAWTTSTGSISARSHLVENGREASCCRRSAPSAWRVHATRSRFSSSRVLGWCDDIAIGIPHDQGPTGFHQQVKYLGRAWTLETEITCDKDCIVIRQRSVHGLERRQIAVNVRHENGAKCHARSPEIAKRWYRLL